MTTQPRDRGVAVVAVAVAMSVLMISTALAVDVGRALVHGRELQLVADVAALDAARTLLDLPEDSTALPTVATAAVRSARRNGVDLDPSAVDIGHLDDGEWRPVRPGDTSWPPSAVRVEADGHVSWMFATGGSRATRSAVATARATGGIAAGGALARLDTSEAALLAPVLTALLGAPAGLDLSTISWEGLADARLTLGEVSAVAGYGSISDYLAADLTVADHLSLVASALGDAGVADLSAQVMDLADAAALGVDLPPVRIADLVSISGGEETLARTELGVLELIHSVALLGNAGGPQVVVETAVDVGPLARVELQATVVEPPRIAFGPIGTQARSAQVDVAVQVQTDIGDQLRDSLGGLLVALLGPVFDLLGVLDVRLSVQGAQTTGTLTAISCSGDRGATTAVVDGDTRLATLDLTLLGVDLTPTVPTGAGRLEFSPPFGWSHRQPVPSTGLDLASVLVDGLAPALDGRLGALGLGALLQPVRAALASIASTVLAPIGDQVLSPALSALGVQLGSGDVAVLAAECGIPRLVQ